jgi:hypothetical protein
MAEATYGGAADELTRAQAELDAIALTAPEIAPVAASSAAAVEAFIQGVESAAPTVDSASAAVIERFVAGITERVGEVISALQRIVVEMQQLFTRNGNAFRDIGSNIMRGIGEGIVSMSSWLRNLVGGYIDNLVASVNARLEIRSPSRVFGRIGGLMAEGLGEGWASGIEGVKREIARSMPTVRDAGVTADLGADIVNGLMGGLPSVMGSSGAQAPIIVQVVLNDRVMSETLYDPLQQVGRRRGLVSA